MLFLPCLFPELPLYNKYPNLSPYVAFADNPIMFVDPDGEDYSIYVIHGDKPQIIIRACYKVGENASIEDAKTGLSKAISFWNNQNFKYVVGDGDNPINYTITFELTVYNRNNYDFVKNGPINEFMISSEDSETSKNEISAFFID